MTHYLDVPYVAGTTALFAQLAADARTSNKRIALIGDSQEDTTGESTAVSLSFFSWQKLGVCSETGICPLFNHGTTAGSSLFWLSAGLSNVPGAKTIADSYIPMGKTVVSSGVSPYGTVLNLAAYKADTNVLGPAGLYSIVDPSAGFVADLFAFTATTGPAELGWISRPVATGPSALSLFATSNASGHSSGVGLNVSDNAPKRWRTPLIPYDPTKPYTQLAWSGSTGSAMAGGAQMCGARLISTATTGGIVWEPFSIGGYTTESVLANHANAGPMFAAMGGPEGWSAIAIGLMNNNAATLGDTAAQYKTKLSALIALLRSWTGTTTPILLLGDPPSTGVTGWGAGGLDKFNEYAGVQAELAVELVDVMSVNSQRLMQDAGYDPANATYSADGSHPTPLGANLRASVIVNAVLRDGLVSNAPTVAQIVAAINADATQITQQTNAATAATQATAAALDASKIPRLSSAVTAGAVVRRNKVAATSTTLDETLEATP